MKFFDWLGRMIVKYQLPPYIKRWFDLVFNTFIVCNVIAIVVILIVQYYYGVSAD